MTSNYFRTDQTYEEWLEQQKNVKWYALSDEEWEKIQKDTELEQCKNT